jgi:ankyrin repeat protein
MTDLKKILASTDYEGLRKALSSNPSLANSGIPFDERNPALAHPLHRICDGVFHKVFSDEQGVELAKIFLDHGADINGFGLTANKDTPLIAAASLNAEKVGTLYVDRGADIHHPGTHGGTALHWAAWVGRDQLVDKLIKAAADVNKRCIDFNSTPLLWAVHGYKFNNGSLQYRQVECVKLLIAAGSDKKTLNKEGKQITDFLSAEDVEMKQLLT